MSRKTQIMSYPLVPQPIRLQIKNKGREVAQRGRGGGRRSSGPPLTTCWVHPRGLDTLIRQRHPPFTSPSPDKTQWIRLFLLFLLHTQLFLVLDLRMHFLSSLFNTPSSKVTSILPVASLLQLKHLLPEWATFAERRKTQEVLRGLGTVERGVPKRGRCRYEMGAGEEGDSVTSLTDSSAALSPIPSRPWEK